MNANITQDLALYGRRWLYRSKPAARRGIRVVVDPVLWWSEAHRAGDDKRREIYIHLPGALTFGYSDGLLRRFVRESIAHELKGRR